MKKLYSLLLALTACSMLALASSPQIIYNGQTLPWNTEFSRTMLGYVKASAVLPEISGIACSRVTPGYLWMESDEDKTCIVATDEAGQTRYKKVNFSTSIDRNDWEDMCGGVYNGKNYLFVGLFGDNNASKGNYQILYIEEPAITGSSTISVAPNIIKFQYPNGIKHNAEAMMYDNVEQMIYIITKVYYDVCQVFKLPMSLNYGSNLQTLTYVCDLGIKADLGTDTNPYKGFHLVTGADISPDGKYILIKNHNNTAADKNEEYSWTLMWTRQGNESLSQTLQRQPEPIGCYEQEWQGEAVCWLDNTTFYTVSDDEEPPIYKYVRTLNGGGNDPIDPDPLTPQSITIDGNFSDWEDSSLPHAELPSGATNTGLYAMRWYADETDIFYYLEYDAQTAHIDILLSTDANNGTGHNSWMWSNSAAEYLIEGEPDSYNDAWLAAFDNTQPQDEWDAGWADSNIEDYQTVCNPVTLANGHRAIEAKINQSKLSAITELRVGVFTMDASWGETGLLPQDGQMLEVPIYRVPTGIGAVESQVKSQKILRNGQLLIIRDGKTFNAQGQQVD